MTIWYLPLEPLEERYTAQMIRWVRGALVGVEEYGHSVIEIQPRLNPEPIRNGQWLDACDTTIWKSLQIGMLAEYVRSGEVKRGDVVLVGDLWMPGIEAIRFLSDMLDLRLTIAGWHYAGCFDPNDLLARTLGPWGQEWERMMLTGVADYICVGSRHHFDLIVKATPHLFDKVLPLGLVWEADLVRGAVPRPSERQKVVVFPHRNAPEKGVEAFVAIAATLRKEFPDWRFVWSTNGVGPAPEGLECVRHKTKEDYYRFLATCGVWFSAAAQETFGYSLHEAIALGVPVVAPWQACYPEMLRQDPRYLYMNANEALTLLRAAMRGETSPAPARYTDHWTGSAKKFITHIMERTR